MPVRFYNTLRRFVEDFVPMSPGKVGLYTCGPTVYNFAHVGNFRAYVFEDVLKRTLRYAGFQVYHIMNLTDVDDKTIRDSQKAGVSLLEFTQRYKDAFFEDIRQLRIDPADVYPSATDHIPEMIEIIRKLFEKGFAYKAEDGSVYFSIAKFPEYGKLAHIDLDGMRPGARVKHDEYAKESVADFALWKAYDEQDGPVAWDSPWGRGRPGWHIECSAMSSKYLGNHFDIHCGGIDNMFPHHEDEIAQSEAANGCTFVNYWLHNAHLIVDGEKMSKSAGNFFTLRDVQQRGYGGREVRWVLLGTHYRQTLNFSFRELDAARVALARVDDFVRRLNEVRSLADAGVPATVERSTQAQADFRASLEDDLNTSGALGALFDLVRDVNRMMDSGQCAGTAAGKVLDQLRDFDKVLACLDVDREDAVPAEIQALVDERQAARKAKDFPRADTARNRLIELGWVVEDTAKGPRVKRKR